MTQLMYRGYLIEPGPAYTPDSRWQYVHPEFTGDTDVRCGTEATPEACRDAIDWTEELIAERREVRAGCA